MTRSSPARRPHLFRVKASLLLAVFLSAGTSLPSLDALAYHQDGAEGGRSQTHIEAAGGCLDHSQHCALGRTAPGSGAVTALAGEVRAEPVQRSAFPRPPAQLRFEIDRTGIPQPRAPPSFRYV